VPSTDGGVQAPKYSPVVAEIPLLQLQKYQPAEFVPAVIVMDTVANSCPLSPASERVVDASSLADNFSSTTSIWKRLLDRPALLVCAGVCILVLMTTAVWVYVSHTRSASKPVKASNVAATTPIDTSGSALFQNKPNAATPISSQPTTSVAPPSAPSLPGATQTKTASHPVVAERRNESVVPPVKIPEQITAPAAPTSGMLHYSGPPVSYGGTVVFSNLPEGRLRFTFDQQSWQPLISHEPHGTQKLTLRSLKTENQTQCDVRWEIVQ